MHQVAEGRGYINEKETQRTLDIFSNVKAATLVSTVETSPVADATDRNDDGNKKEELTEVNLVAHFSSNK